MSNHSSSPNYYVFFLVIILTGVVVKGYAQVNATQLENRIGIDTSRRLEIQLPVLGFVKNNEYFNELREGYTLWGLQFNPSLTYGITDQLVLKGGFFYRKDFGEDKGNKPELTFSLKYTHQAWNYIFGTLEGSLHHRLIEPLYNFERYLLTPVENGLQINHIGKKHFFDFWIAYPQNTLPGYSRQEHFWGGVSTSLNLLDEQEVHLHWIMQATVFHAGGQGISSGLPVRTAVNSTVGLGLEWRPGGGLHGVRIEPYWVYSSGEQGKSISGNALYLNGTLDTRWIRLMVSYWKGKRFESEYGGDLFVSSSRSITAPAAYRTTREWVMVRLIKEIVLAPGLVFMAHFEPYFDTSRRKIEHSEVVGVSYVLRENFGLKRK